MSEKWNKEFKISKLDNEQRLVFGWASVATEKSGKPLTDLHEDIIPVPEIEKAAYEYVLYSRRGGEMHKKTRGVMDLVESVCFTKEKCQAMGIPEGTIADGSWWVGFKIASQDAWDLVKSGDYAAFSIGGRAVRSQVRN